MIIVIFDRHAYCKHLAYKLKGFLSVSLIVCFFVQFYTKKAIFFNLNLSIYLMANLVNFLVKATKHYLASIS